MRMKDFKSEDLKTERFLSPMPFGFYFMVLFHP